MNIAIQKERANRMHRLKTENIERATFDFVLPFAVELQLERSWNVKLMSKWERNQLNPQQKSNQQVKP